uniref:Uncharacterized protein LOC111104827 isoform X2 n=1 Tax=Crassostrea virginica TaxID=6565 RepID=A0A8B8AUB3_CRAVI|nr:uncharacterized protein LOC111104827 isoform X2 [Crassostrea virginica]
MDSVEGIYRFDPDREHQGLAVVIVNFTTGGEKRDGAELDLNYMKETFERLGFIVECHRDKTKPEMEKLLNDYSKREDLKKYSCFAIGISSHGVERTENAISYHAIEMFDHGYLYTKDVIDYFSERKCAALRNKPKLFFIQACRIPESKASKQERDVGIGFDAGSKAPVPVNPGQGSSADKTDNRQSEDKERFEDCIVSYPESHEIVTRMQKEEGTGEDEWDLERAHMDNVKSLGGILVGDNSLKESKITNQNSSASSSQNKDDQLQRGANQNKEQTPGDEIDPPKGTRFDPVLFTSVPCENNMLIMFASPQGHYAFRNETDGSYMLRYLYEVVEKHYKNGGLQDNQTSFLDILTEVASRMSEKTYFGQKMYTIVPCLVHKLYRDIIFTQGKNMVQ